MHSPQNHCQPASTAAVVPKTTSNMHGLGGSPANDDFCPPTDSHTPDVDHEAIISYQPDQSSSFYQFEEDSQQFQTSAPQGNPLARAFHSPSSRKGSVGSSGEVAWNRKSPDNFTPNAVMANPSTDQNPLLSAILSVKNNLTCSPGSINFNNPRHGRQFPNSSHRTAASPYLAHFPLASPHGQHPQGLGIYGPLYDSELSLMTAMRDNTQYSMSEQGFANQDRPDLVHTQFAQIYDSEPAHNAVASLEGTCDAPGDDSATEGHSARSTIYPSPEQSTQTMANIPRTPHLSETDRKNYTPISTNTPCSVGTPAYSFKSDDSPRSVSAFPHTNGNMPKSGSCPTFTAFKKPAQPLTAWQTVDESTHQPTMDLVEVALQHENSRLENLKVKSMDYRDRSWQGRSDEYKGWTPYVNFADFPDILEMLRNMRCDPSGYMPDNATIFKSMEQVNEWREKEKTKSCRNQDLQDEEELPRTAEEKAAVVKLLFKAFKSTVDAQSNSDVLKSFNNQIHSNAHVEAICWQLLEAAIERSKGGPLCYAYEPGKPAKSAGDRNLGFAQRINDLIQALMWEKSVCVNLLRAPKVCDAIDYPSWLGKRTSNNRNLNNKKAEIAKLGKTKLEELENEYVDDIPRKLKAASRPPTRRGKRSNKQFDDEDSESTKESPPKRHSPNRSIYATPVRRFAALNTACNSYPVQVTPSSTAMASNNSTPPSRFTSPVPSTTSSIRDDMARYNLSGLSQPNFPRSIPQSPLRQSASLATGYLPPHRYSAEYGHHNDFLAANNLSDEDRQVFY